MIKARRELADAAATWAARMDGGSWTDVDEADLQAWLSKDERRAGALLQAQAAWAYIDPALQARTGEPKATPAPSRRRVMGMGGAAIAASLVGVLAWTRIGKSYRTDVGEIRRVPLGDGSIAAINTASELDIRFAEKRRDVRLMAGEAWFQVAKDPARPFVVQAGPVRVQAVGTAFSVRRRADGAEILVTEGIVAAWSEGTSGHRTRIAAGSRAFVADDAGVQREAVAGSSIDHSLAWRSGKIDLEGERLDQAVAEFNRYNHRQLIIADPALASEQLDGVFGTDDPEGFAKAVRTSLGIPVDMSNPTQIRIGGSP